jgi:hypothetical protein
MTPTERDARRFRTLMTYFKSDHIWYHVFHEEDRERGNSVEQVLDNIADDPQDHFVYR